MRRNRNAGLWRALPVVLLACLAAGLLSLARGARLHAADFTFNNASEVTTLDPATQTDLPGGRVVRAIFEGLVVLHPETLEPLPGAAESWTLSEDGRVYTFDIRPDAQWTNGDPLTAHDFVYAFRRLLDPRTAASYAYLLWGVRGARAYTTEVTDGGVPENDFESVGISAPGAHTLVIELDAPSPFFLDIVAYTALCPVNRRSIEEARERWPETWETEWLRPEHIVTNGPFRIVERRINDRMRLERWEDYWDAENVALRTIDVLAVEQGATALNMYLTGSVDFIERIHPSLAREMMRREDFVPRPYLGTYFYRLNVTRPPLDDVRVRRALHLTLPREEVCTGVLGMGQVAARSLVPPILAAYESPAPAQPAARDSEAERARDLLADAGFRVAGRPEAAGGRPFPPIEIHYNTAEVHASIAQVVAAAWRDELGIEVKLRNEEWKVFLDSQKSLRFEISRASWICDYADPSSYLDIFATGNENNRTGWGDPRYDELVARARLEQDAPTRLALLRDAERILMDELPILPVYFYVHQNVVAPRLGGFHHNVLDAHFPKFFYWMDDAELAERRAAREARGSRRIRVEPHGPREGLYAPARARPRGPRSGVGP